jgi:transcriptional regulator with XRE-family HTH domain
MRFGEFIKSCRQTHQLTQEQLVHALYIYDSDLFHGLDTTTLSKWERSVTQPNVSKQLKILQYFQTQQESPLPCVERYSEPESEMLLCDMGIKHLIIGKRKDLVLNFPSEMMRIEDLGIEHVRHIDRKEIFLEVAGDMRNSVHPSYTCISKEMMLEWSLHPNNLFWVCQYKGFIIGFLFVLRLKPQVQEKILHFNKAFSELTIDDFASSDERGDHIITHFFAWNDKAATLLIIRYYAHLIANQHTIGSIGAAVYYEEGKEILSNMNLKAIDSYSEGQREITAYREELRHILLNEKVIRILFHKELCPEE